MWLIPWFDIKLDSEVIINLIYVFSSLTDSFRLNVRQWLVTLNFITWSLASIIWMMVKLAKHSIWSDSISKIIEFYQFFLWFISLFILLKMKKIWPYIRKVSCHWICIIRLGPSSLCIWISSSPQTLNPIWIWLRCISIRSGTPLYTCIVTLLDNRLW